MNKRRDFLKGAGVVGALAGAFVGTKVVINEKEKSNKDTIAEIEKISPAVLQIQTRYGEIENTPSSQYAFTNISVPKYKPGTEKTQVVKFLPGPDGELYIHTNGQWKKVITT